MSTYDNLKAKAAVVKNANSANKNSAQRVGSLLEEMIDFTNDISLTPGQDGITPHIDPTTGNWFLDNVNTGVHAQGPQGEAGPAGADGPAGIPGPQGPQGEPGDSFRIYK